MPQWHATKACRKVVFVNISGQYVYKRLLCGTENAVYQLAMGYCYECSKYNRAGAEIESDLRHRTTPSNYAMILGFERHSIKCESR